MAIPTRNGRQDRIVLSQHKRDCEENSTGRAALQRDLINAAAMGVAPASEQCCAPQNYAPAPVPQVLILPTAREPHTKVRSRRNFKPLMFRDIFPTVLILQRFGRNETVGLLRPIPPLSQSQKYGRLCQTLLKPKGISTLIGAVWEFALVKWRRERCWARTLSVLKSLFLLRSHFEGVRILHRDPNHARDQP